MDRILLLGRDGWMVVRKSVLHGPLQGGPQAYRFKWRDMGPFFGGPFFSWVFLTPAKPSEFSAIYFRPPQRQSTGRGTNTQNIAKHQDNFFGVKTIMESIESTDPLSRRGSSTLFLSGCEERCG